jgi:hypothetical protein
MRTDKLNYYHSSLLKIQIYSYKDNYTQHSLKGIFLVLH